MGLFQKDSQVHRSLILAGGGVRLAYHAGVLIALEEEGIGFQHVDGTSGGIFGTAMLASGVNPKEAAQKWKNLKLKRFMGILPWREYIGKQKAQPFRGADGIRKSVFPSLGIDIQAIHSNSEFQATFNVCNFSKKTIESIDNKEITIDHLIAGMSLPMVMPAIKINGDWYTDAVWIKDANLTEAVNRGAEEIWLIWCIGNTREYLKGYFNEYVHMIEISANSAIIQELEWIKDKNEQRNQKGLPPISVHIVKPDYPLPLDPDFFFKKIDATTLINMGYADTKTYLANKHPFDFKDATQATLMKYPVTTLHFRQRFEGCISLLGTKMQIVLHLAFFLRKLDGEYVMQQFSSFELPSGSSLIGFDNTLSISEQGIWKGAFRFLYDKHVYKAHIRFRIPSPIDLFWGIETKRIELEITDETNSLFRGILYQSIFHRIKNALHIDVNENGHIFTKIKSAFQLLNQLLKSQA